MLRNSDENKPGLSHFQLDRVLGYITMVLGYITMVLGYVHYNTVTLRIVLFHFFPFSRAPFRSA